MFNEDQLRAAGGMFSPLEEGRVRARIASRLADDATEISRAPAEPGSFIVGTDRERAADLNRRAASAHGLAARAHFDVARFKNKDGALTAEHMSAYLRHKAAESEHLRRATAYERSS